MAVTFEPPIIMKADVVAQTFGQEREYFGTSWEFRDWVLKRGCYEGIASGQKPAIRG